jgi:hypothetical protein
MTDEIDDSEIIESIARVPGKAGRPPKSASAPRPAANRVRRPSRPQTLRADRAPQREEIREEERPAEGQRLQRLTRTNTEDRDKFYVSPKSIPHNTSYEWKREKTYGASDPFHQLSLRENHWRPVPASRHPELMPEGTAAGPITRDGMILMERPSYLTKEAQQEYYNKAREQVTGRETALRKDPEGGFEGGRSHQSARNNTRINKSYEPFTGGSD